LSAPRNAAAFAALAGTCAALAGCLVSYDLPEFDELARTSHYRTILLEEDYSLYSPFDGIATRDYAQLVVRHRAELLELFGIESAPPTLVELRPTEGIGVDVEAEGNGLRILAASTEPHDGVLGWAPGNHVVIAVDAPQKVRLADGREIEGAWNASTFESTIRHELAHAAVFLSGVEDGGWLHEGMAHAVQWLPVEDGRFRLEPRPEQLAWASASPREARSLERLVAWRQSLPPTDGDVEVRLLAFSLVAFWFEREGSPRVRDGFPRLAALGRAEIVALEPEWSAWLDALAAAQASAKPAPFNPSAERRSARP
jgi:hypothetical protein